MESFIRYLAIAFIFGLGILLVGGFIFLFLGMITSCPLCGRRFAQKSLGVELVGSERTTKQGTRRLPVKGGRSSEGGHIHGGYVNMPVQIPIIKETYQHTYQCRYCNRHWFSHFSMGHKV